MRLCVAIPCFFGNDNFCESIRRVRALGYDAVETYNWKTLDLDEVKRTLDETGVELLSICTTEFRLTSPEHRGAFVDGIVESCAAAKRLGAKKMITQVGADTGSPRTTQHASIVAGLRAAAPILEENGITLMIEPLYVLVNHPGYYLTSANEAFDIIKEVASPNVRVIYDIYHQQVTEGNIIPTVTQNLELIAHLHGAGHPGRNEMQYGESNYRVIIDAIDKAGYGGALGLEYKPLLDPEESLREALLLFG